MKSNQLKNLRTLLFFTKEQLRQFESRPQALDFNLKYWLKQGSLITLKNGMYITKSNWEREFNKTEYLEYLASKLYEPSYLSGEYVMDQYGLLTEGVTGITSFTTKSPKLFNNSIGQFTYYSISEKLFTGYEIFGSIRMPIPKARKAKAVFDFLYLRFLKKAAISPQSVEELRINWEHLSATEFKELKSYAQPINVKRIDSVIKIIENLYYA